MPNLYLIRHAQSEANVSPHILHVKPNARINLTDLGKIQASETGQFLKTKIKDLANIKMWHSPFDRTRQTASIICASLGIESIENLHIVERQLGLVEDMPDYGKKYPEFVNLYKLAATHESEFFTRPPLGESPFDVCLRLETFLNNCVYPAMLLSKKDVVVVSHGAAIKCLESLVMNQPYETIGRKTNPKNASILQIEIENETFKNNGFIFQPSVSTE